MSEFLMYVLGTIVATLIAKQFVKDIQNEVAAHDDCSTMSDNDDDR